MSAATLTVDSARALGHTLENDPPHALSRFGRLTCTDCGCAVIVRPDGSCYGSATEQACTKASQ